MNHSFLPCVALATALCLTAPAFAHDAGSADKTKLEKVFPAKPAYSPYAGRNFPIRPFFGDTAHSSTRPGRRWLSLNGDWQFQTIGAPADQWKTIAVPSTFEEHEGLSFDGVGWYPRALPALALQARQRVLLHFQAAATAAEVWIDDCRLGAHVGGWTPFRFDY